MAIVGTALLGIAIAAGYIRLDGVLPSGVAESVVIRGARQGPILLILIGSAALALGGFMIWIAIRSRARSLFQCPFWQASLDDGTRHHPT